jgi:hypothetical protein
MSAIREFAKTQGRSWDEIFKAEELTAANYEIIRNQFKTLPSPMTSTDADLIVFGSIARNECTAKSDVDWTLLVDGQANSNHLNIAHLSEDALTKTKLAEPGKSGMFGQITFSHDLIHYIGGQDDTNHNLSRRILLLLESSMLLNDKSDGSAYERVIRGVIGKYIDNDSGFKASGKENVPRFLLNDIIRFWRTMCVDFAYKQIEQKGQNWALRNIKLRMSRRLIFVKGLLMCAKLYGTKGPTEEIKEELYKFVVQKPLEFMVSTFLEFGIPTQHIIQTLDSYDSYLGTLNDEDYRKYLSSLDMHQAYGNEKFEAARQNSHKFQLALNDVFLKDENKIKDFTIKYGVF